VGKFFLLNSIRKKLIFTFLIIAIVPLVVSNVLSYSRMSTFMEESFNSDIQKSMGQFDMTLSAHLKALLDSVTYLAEQPGIKNVDSTLRVFINDNPQQIGEAEKAAQKAFEAFIKAHPDYTTAFIGTEYGGFREYNNDKGYEGYDPRQRSWYKNALQNKEKAVLIDPYLATTKAIEVTASKAIVDPSGKVLGVVAAAMTLDNFNKLLESANTQKSASILLAFPDGNIITYPKQPELNFQPLEKLGIPELKDFPKLKDGSYEMTYNGEKHLVNILTSPGTGWRYVALVEYKELFSQLNSLQNVMFLAIAIIVAAVIAIAFYYARKFSHPIQLITSHAQKVASGDITDTINYRSNDELGNLTKHFNEMIISLREIVDRVKRTSSQVKASAESVMQGAADATAATNAIAATMSQVAAGINGQVASIAESTVSMAELSTGVQRVAESAASVAELTMATYERATKGAEHIEKSIAQMSVINQVTNESVEVVNRLVTRTQEIEKALQTITGIANQTNLLALNAAIEAARVGEHGKGFAVVADEVRGLAEQSRESANEINQLLLQIQSDTNDVVEAMQRGKGEASQGIEVVREAGMAFRQIVEGINEITTQMQEVSAATEEMSAGTEEISASLEEIAAVSKQVSQQTDETATTAQEQTGAMDKMASLSAQMKTVSEELETLVSQFKTNRT
jgi:methyl-accepting chemotaxis protein